MLWILRRVGISLALVWVVASIVFMALHLVPGDPAELLLSTGGVSPDPAAVAELRERLGLDLPLMTQYGSFLAGLLRGDLGSSLVDDYPVAQEIALLAARSDVREELDRLSAHIDAARALLKAGEAAGRKLEFLTQEFVREANTLCSKSGSARLTAIGLDLKHVIDQMREQVQNLE